VLGVVERCSHAWGSFENWYSWANLKTPLSHPRHRHLQQTQHNINASLSRIATNNNKMMNTVGMMGGGLSKEECVM